MCKINKSICGLLACLLLMCPPASSMMMMMMMYVLYVPSLIQVEKRRAPISGAYSVQSHLLPCIFRFGCKSRPSLSVKPLTTSHHSKEAAAAAAAAAADEISCLFLFLFLFFQLCRPRVLSHPIQAPSKPASQPESSAPISADTGGERKATQQDREKHIHGGLNQHLNRIMVWELERMSEKSETLFCNERERERERKREREREMKELRRSS